MKMLGLVFAIAALLCFSTSAFGELSVEDLEKIRQIVNEAEGRLEKRIDAVKEQLDTRITELERHFTAQIQGQGNRITDLRDRINFQGHLMVALIVSIIGFVAVPLSFLVYQYNKQRDQQRDEIYALRQRIEELEGKQIIQP